MNPIRPALIAVERAALIALIRVAAFIYGESRVCLNWASARLQHLEDDNVQ